MLVEPTPKIFKQIKLKIGLKHFLKRCESCQNKQTQQQWKKYKKACLKSTRKKSKCREMLATLRTNIDVTSVPTAWAKKPAKVTCYIRGLPLLVLPWQHQASKVLGLKSGTELTSLANRYFNIGLKFKCYPVIQSQYTRVCFTSNIIR